MYRLLASEIRIFVIQSVFDAPPPVSHCEFRSLAATGSVILHEHRLKSVHVPSRPYPLTLHVLFTGERKHLERDRLLSLRRILSLFVKIIEGADGPVRFVLWKHRKNNGIYGRIEECSVYLSRYPFSHDVVQYGVCLDTVPVQ